MYSMGSSMVTILVFLSRLMRFIKAARVVVLPCPLGPTTRTNPWLIRLNIFMTGGRFSSSMSGMLEGMKRKVAAGMPLVK